MDTKSLLEESLLRIFADLVPHRRLSDPETRFLASGFDSVELTRIAHELQRRLAKGQVSPVLLFEHNSVRRLAERLMTEEPDVLARLL